MTRARGIALLTALLLLAALFRLARLTSVPPGLSHDEAIIGLNLAEASRGRPVHLSADLSAFTERLEQNSGALLALLLGRNYFTVRLHSAFYGLLLVAASAAWARRAFNRKVAAVTAALLAVSYWPTATSRFALEVEVTAAFVTLGMAFLWRGLSAKRAGRDTVLPWTLAGACLSLAILGYPSGRVGWLAALCFALYGWAVLRGAARARLLPLSVAVTGALILALPHLLDPAVWRRVGLRAGMVVAGQSSLADRLLKNAVEALSGLVHRGDPFILYNLPGRPVFDLFTFALFCLGLAICIRRWRTAGAAHALIWAFLGFAPTLILGVSESTTQSSAAQTPMLTLAAIGAVEGARFLARRWPRLAGAPVRILLALWLTFVAAAAFRDYFIVWANSPSTRAAYFASFSGQADYLQRSDYSGAVAISSAFPERIFDPAIANQRLTRPGLDTFWFDGREALVFPAAEEALVLAPNYAPLDEYFRARLHLDVLDRVTLRPDDVDPFFDVYRWRPAADLVSILATLQTGEVRGDSGPLSLPANFGDTVELLGYDLITPKVRPGGEVRLVSYWRVLDPEGLGPPPPDVYGRRATLFIHALGGPDGNLGQQDRLDAPASAWRAGMVFAQIHRFALEAATSPGQYPLDIGIYTPADGARLPVLVHGEIVSSRVILPPVRVTP